MREGFCRVARRVTRDAATKCVHRQKIHELREKQACRRTLRISEAEKPQSPKSKLKSVTPPKSFFFRYNNPLPCTLRKIAGQQCGPVTMFLIAIGQSNLIIQHFSGSAFNVGKMGLARPPQKMGLARTTTMYRIIAVGRTCSVVL
jgi:hypothetical protein